MQSDQPAQRAGVDGGGAADVAGAREFVPNHGGNVDEPEQQSLARDLHRADRPGDPFDERGERGGGGAQRDQAVEVPLRGPGGQREGVPHAVDGAAHEGGHQHQSRAAHAGQGHPRARRREEQGEVALGSGFDVACRPIATPNSRVC